MYRYVQPRGTQFNDQHLDGSESTTSKKKKNIMNKFNLVFTFNTSLQEVPDNPKSMASFIEVNKLKLDKVKDPLERIMILGELGSYARILERLDEAEQYLDEAMTLIENHDLGVELWVQNGIRLAQVYQWQGRYEVVKQMFCDLEEICELEEDVFDYMHFVIHHRGKFNFQIGCFEEALECFEEALEIRKILGDQVLIDSSKHAIAMTKMRLEEEKSNLIDFPIKGNFQGDEVKSASDFTQMIREHFEDEEYSSLEEMNEELQKIAANQNSLRVPNFLGLSPKHMHGIIYSPFSLDNNIFRFENKNISEIEKIPFMKQAIYFLEKLKNDGFIKATKKGYLSKAFVVEIYHEFFSKEKYSRLPSKEGDLLQLTRLKHILDMTGLIKKRSGKFLLTKKGETLIRNDDFFELFKALIGTFFNKWNWGYGDSYSKLVLIQQTAVFNIYILNKKAQDWILDKELGKSYLEAFPMLVHEVEFSYFTPEIENVNCFCTRFLYRICLSLGLLEIKEEGPILERKIFYRVTPLFKKIFNFKL